jgi:hypothetical protein
MPLYNVDQFLIWRQLAHAHAGGRTYLSIFLYWIRFHVFLDLWAAHLTWFDNYMHFNVVDYSDFCDTAGWLAEIGRMQVYL